MSPTALRGITHPNPEPGPANQTPSRGELCPDVLAVARDLGVTRARDLRHLQALYDRYTAAADADWDFGGHVLTYLRGRQSVPVDIQTGERATRRLDKQRSYR